MIIEVLTAVLAPFVTLGPAEHGLAIGTKKTFVFVSEGQPAQKVDTEVVKSIQGQGMEVYFVRTTSSVGKPYHEFVGLSSKGLFEFWPRNMESTDPDLQTPANPHWIFGKKVGESWNWRHGFRGQVMAGPDGQGPNMEDLASDCVGTIISSDIELAVPAGKFKTTHVRIVKTSKGLGTSTIDAWYAPKIGLVKEETLHDGRRWSQTLGSYDQPK